MADLFIAAVAEIGAAIGGIEGAVAIMYSVEIGTALYYTTVIAGSIAYGNSRKRAAARAARDAYNAALQDRLIMVPVVDAGRSRIYGIVRNVDGIAFKASRGADKEFFTMVVSCSGHEIDGFESIWLDDAPVTRDGDGYVTDTRWLKEQLVSAWETKVLGAQAAGDYTFTLEHTPHTGGHIAAALYGGAEDPGTPCTIVAIGTNSVTVTLPAILGAGDLRLDYQWNDGKPRVRVRTYTGAAGQNVSNALAVSFPGVVLATDRFSIGAQLLVDLEYDPDVFNTGVPAFSAVMRGAKVLDRRTGVTAFTRNSALIADDWARYQFGGALPFDVVDDELCKTAANTCDIAKTFTGPGRSFTGPQFICDLAVPLNGDQDAARVMDDIVATMAGRWTFSAGQLVMRAGSYRAPAITIDESWLHDKSALRLLNDSPTSEVVNTMRARFADSLQNFVPVTSASVPVAAYVTEDGGEKLDEITLAGVTDELRIGHVLTLMIREKRFAFNGSLPLKMQGLQLKVFTVARLLLPTFGIDATIEVLDWAFSQQGGVTAVFKDARAEVWDPLALLPLQSYSDNTTHPDPTDVPDLQVFALSGPAQLIAQADGTVVSRVRVFWAAVTDRTIADGGRIEVAYKLQSEPLSAWRSLEVPGTQVDVMLSPVVDSALYVVRGRCANRLVRGRWSQQVQVQAVAKTARPGNVSGVAVSLTGLDAVVRWAALASPDYARTEVRIGAPSGSLVFSGAATSFPLRVGEGDTTLYLRHFNRSGWDSVAATAFTFTAFAPPLAGNLVDSTWWRPGAPWAWRLIESPGGGENALVYGTGPAGAVEVLWQCTSVDSVQNPPAFTDDPDGGWQWDGATHPRNHFAVDPSKTYRFDVPAFLAAGTCSAYWGMQGDHNAFWVSGAAATDPYFVATGGLPAGKWVRLVGYVFPAGAAPTGASDLGAGVFDAATGELLIAGTNRVWDPATTVAGCLAFQFYAPPGSVLRFGRPSVFMVNGNEPPLFDRLGPALAAAAAAQSTADGKINTFYGTVPPLGVGESEGDLWFDTDDGFRQYRHTSGSWGVVQDTRIGQALLDAATATSIANGKTAAFFQAAPPVADQVDDIWFDTDDSNAPYRWTGAAWVPYTFGTSALTLGATIEAGELFAADSGEYPISFGSKVVVAKRFTVPATCKMKVQALCDAAGVDGDAGRYVALFICPWSLVNDSGQPDLWQSNFTSINPVDGFLLGDFVPPRTARQPVTLESFFDVTAGTDIAVGMVARNSVVFSTGPTIYGRRKISWEFQKR